MHGSMRAVGIAFVACVAAVMPACALRANPGRVQAWAVAAHAGQFHRERGRWPADMGELASLPCPRLDEAGGFGDTGGAADVSDADGIEPPPVVIAPCVFVATFGYEVSMQPRGSALAMTFRDAAAREVCKLRVTAPDARRATIAPMVRIRTTVFACPGENE